MYNRIMAKHVIHVSETEAASDFASLMARVRAGAEVVIEQDARPVAVLRPAEPRDLGEIINSHREPLSPPAWD